MGNLIWIALVIAASGLTLLLYWQREVNIPRLIQTPLPPYDIPDVILVGGVLIENRGLAPAPNVKIAIEYDDADRSKIHHMQVESDEPYILRGGGEQYNFATIRLNELGPGKRLFVYWAAADPVQPHISVTSFRPPDQSFRGSGRQVWLDFLRNLPGRVRR